MDFRTIFEDNVYEYSDFIDSDVAENMTRINFRGIAGHDPLLDGYRTEALSEDVRRTFLVNLHL